MGYPARPTPADIRRFPDLGLLPHPAPPGYVRPSVYTSPRGPDPHVERITANLLERMRAAR